MSREKKKANEKEKKRLSFCISSDVRVSPHVHAYVKRCHGSTVFFRSWLRFEYCHHSMNDAYGVAYEAEDLNIFFYVILTSTHCYLSHNQPGF